MAFYYSFLFYLVGQARGSRSDKREEGRIHLNSKRGSQEKQQSTKEERQLRLPCWVVCCWRANRSPHRDLPRLWRYKKKIFRSTRQEINASKKDYLEPCTFHFRPCRFVSPSFSVICAVDIASGRSCLLAKTRRTASLSSASLSKDSNSFCA